MRVGHEHISKRASLEPVKTIEYVAHYYDYLQTFSLYKTVVIRYYVIIALP